jgi:hypothetical protein
VGKVDRRLRGGGPQPDISTEVLKTRFWQPLSVLSEHRLTGPHSEPTDDLRVIRSGSDDVAQALR